MDQTKTNHSTETFLKGIAMREIISHKAFAGDSALLVVAMDGPGPGNACHEYAIQLFKPGSSIGVKFSDSSLCEISFQNGPVLEFGVNGITNESLLAIVIDRLQGFQSGPFACRENAIALTKLQEALMWLQSRTVDRLRRGVEGTNNV